MYTQADSGNRYLIFNAMVKRTANDAGILLGNNPTFTEFRVMTASGKILNPRGFGKPPELEAELVHGGTTEGYLTYEVPDGPGTYYLVLDPATPLNPSGSTGRLVWGVEVP